MKDKIFKYASLIFGAAIVVLIIVYAFKGCGKQPCEPEIRTDTIYEVDTDTIIMFISKPKYIREIVKVPEYINQETDTFSILLQYGYFSERLYDTVVQNDSSCYERLRYSAWMNNVQFIQREFINKRPHATIINTSVFSKARGRIGIGFGANYYWGQNAPQNRLGVELQAQYISKSWWGIEGNCDPFNQYAGGKLLIMFGKANRKN